MSQSSLNAPRRNWRYWLVALAVLFIYAWGASFLIDQVLARTADLGWLVLLGFYFYIGMALWMGFSATRPIRVPLFMTDVEDVGFEYEDVRFRSRDGLTLSGWYVPSQNGAAVILNHGFRENRLGGIPIARMLSKAGYGVLLYDLRGHGRSEGNLSTWGWAEVNDLLGALDFICGRSEVDPQRVGAYGFSLGGQIALHTAAQDQRIRAVVADGTSPAVLSDHTYNNRFQMSRQWLYNVIAYQFQALLLGVRPPAGVAEQMGKITPRPVLLISTGTRNERNNNREYFRRAKEPRELWELSDIQHGEGPSRYPEQYEERVVGFFDGALGV